MRGRCEIPGLTPDIPVQSWDMEEYIRLLPYPDAADNKFSRGFLRIAAGSTSYPGSAVLAALGAIRSGAGYVQMVSPAPIVSLIQSSTLVSPVKSCGASAGAFAADAADDILAGRTPDALLFGPGVSVTPATGAVCLELLERAQMPLLLDADALTMLASSDGCMQACSERAQQSVLTPHEGEMRRLIAGIGAACADSALETEAERVSAAFTLAKQLDATVVFKGSNTYIASSEMVLCSDFGTPSLATAGTGDVLAGMIAALMAHGLDAFPSAALGVYLHSLAGRVAERRHGRISVVATDVADCIGEAILEMEKEDYPDRTREDTVEDDG